VRPNGFDCLWAKRFLEHFPDPCAQNISALSAVRQSTPRAESLLVSSCVLTRLHRILEGCERGKTFACAPRPQRGTAGRYDGHQRSRSFDAIAPHCLSEPLHPNDYLSRWYAQSLLAAPTASEPNAAEPSSGKARNRNSVNDPGRPITGDALILSTARERAAAK